MAGRGISAFGPATFHMKRSGRKLHLWCLNAPALLWAAVGAPMLGSCEKAEPAGVDAGGWTPTSAPLDLRPATDGRTAALAVSTKPGQLQGAGSLAAGLKPDCTGRGLCGSGQDHSIRADALCVGGGIRWTLISPCVRPWAPGPGDNRWLDRPWSGPRGGVSCRSRSWT